MRSKPCRGGPGTKLASACDRSLGGQRSCRRVQGIHVGGRQFAGRSSGDCPPSAPPRPLRRPSTAPARPAPPCISALRLLHPCAVRPPSPLYCIHFIHHEQRGRRVPVRVLPRPQVGPARKVRQQALHTRVRLGQLHRAAVQRRGGSCSEPGARLTSPSAPLRWRSALCSYRPGALPASCMHALALDAALLSLPLPPPRPAQRACRCASMMKSRRSQSAAMVHALFTRRSCRGLR